MSVSMYLAWTNTTASRRYYFYAPREVVDDFPLDRMVKIC